MNFGFLVEISYTAAVDGKDSTTRHFTGMEGEVVFIQISELWVSVELVS